MDKEHIQSFKDALESGPHQQATGQIDIKVTPNKERIQLWIDALRSGAFNQTTAKLQNHQGEMCCLGVACEIYRRVTGLGAWIDSTPTDGLIFQITKEIESSASQFPPSVQVWFGLDRANPIIGSGSHIEDLEDLEDLDAVQANDNLHWEFTEIADALEALYINPPALP